MVIVLIGLWVLALFGLAGIENEIENKKNQLKLARSRNESEEAEQIRGVMVPLTFFRWVFRVYLIAGVIAGIICLFLFTPLLG